MRFHVGKRANLSIVAVVSACAVTPSLDPDLRSLGPDQACGCSIVLRHAATLGRQRDNIGVLLRSDLARDSRGFYYLAPLRQEGSVAVLSQEGLRVGSVGKFGRGEGELSRIRDVKIMPGDSLWVLDDERLTLFSPTRHHVRTTTLPKGLQAFRMTALADGKVLLNNHMPRRRNFTLLDGTLEEVRTFGHSIADTRFPDFEAMLSLVAALDSGRFAAVQANYRYLIQIWDTAGNLRSQFQRDPEWFPRSSYEERLALTPRSPPVTRIIGAHADLKKRHLWIVARVPDARWRTVAPRPDPNLREYPGWLGLPLADYEKAYDTVIEVVDLTTGTPVVTQRFDGYVTGVAEEGLLYGLREHTAGLLAVEVWQPEIVTGR